MSSSGEVDSLVAAEAAAEAAAGRRLSHNYKIWIFYWSYFLAGHAAAVVRL